MRLAHEAQVIPLIASSMASVDAVDVADALGVADVLGVVLICSSFEDV